MVCADGYDIEAGDTLTNGVASYEVFDISEGIIRLEAVPDTGEGGAYLAMDQGAILTGGWRKVLA